MAFLRFRQFLRRLPRGLILVPPLTGLALADSLQTADSLGGFVADDLWLDTAAAAADTLRSGALQNWVYPLGLALATVAGVYLLFTVRSK